MLKSAIRTIGVDQNQVVSIGIDGHPANIKACQVGELPASICVAHTAHLMSNAALKGFSELRAFVVAQCQLCRASGSRTRLLALCDATLPKLPLFIRWGDALRFAAELVDVWEIVGSTWRRFGSTSESFSGIIRGFEPGSLVHAEAMVAARFQEAIHQVLKLSQPTASDDHRMHRAITTLISCKSSHRNPPGFPSCTD